MDYALEATYLRTALLLGLVRGDVVHRWAEQVIDRKTAPGRAFIDIVSTSPSDLSGLRHALWPLVLEPEPPAVLEAVLGRLYTDLTSGRRGTSDTATVLRQMRSLLRLPPTLNAELNAVLVAHDGERKPRKALVTRLRHYERSRPAV